MEIVILFAILVLLLSISVPIGVGLGLSTLLTMLLTSDIPVIMIAQYAFTALDSFPLMAIPFFIMAGNLMTLGGISRRIIEFTNLLIGKVAGSLGIVTVLASSFFAAISGSGPATVSAIGSMMIPEMTKSGYNKSFATALTCAAGIIGVIIPPSIPFVLYGVITGVSIGELFLAGFLPGFLIAAVLIAICYQISKKRGYGLNQGDEVRVSSNNKSLFRTFLDSFWALLTPIIILGGIYSGVFTPTESAVVAVFYALFASGVIYRELTLKIVLDSIRDTVVTTAICLFTIGLSMGFASYLTMEQIPMKIANIILSISNSPFVILLLINIFLLIVGCFIDNISSMTILTPIFYPIVVNHCGVDPIQFGVFMTVNLSIGFITPPYGANLFVATGVTGLKIEDITKEIMPFFLGLILCLILVTYIPGISMFLPNFFYD
jgi:C4-dicarboxylate transporter DctM subunit